MFPIKYNTVKFKGIIVILLAYSPYYTDILSAHANHRVCSLIGVEGGHAIGGSLGVLRTLYQVGVRYLTLTSTCDTPWAECAAVDRPEPSLRGGLTPFGKVLSTSRVYCNVNKKFQRV